MPCTFKVISLYLQKVIAWLKSHSKQMCKKLWWIGKAVQFTRMINSTAKTEYNGKLSDSLQSFAYSASVYHRAWFEWVQQIPYRIGLSPESFASYLCHELGDKSLGQGCWLIKYKHYRTSSPHVLQATHLRPNKPSLQTLTSPIWTSWPMTEMTPGSHFQTWSLHLGSVAKLSHVIWVKCCPKRYRPFYSR